jgi:small-conductance mechanosensitive channel
VGDVRGNVVDITTGHIFLEEVGRYGGEDLSGRVILIPNANLLDKDIINYSYQNDYVLGQVSFSVTYESDFDEAVRLVLQVANDHTKDFNKAAKKEAHYRMSFKDSGIEIQVRYHVPVSLAQKVATEISYDIHKVIKASSKVEMAYPHLEILKKTSVS